MWKLAEMGSNEPATDVWTLIICFKDRKSKMWDQKLLAPAITLHAFRCFLKLFFRPVSVFIMGGLPLPSQLKMIVAWIITDTVIH